MDRLVVSNIYYINSYYYVYYQILKFVFCDQQQPYNPKCGRENIGSQAKAEDILVEGTYWK